jgi:hypothetical protein
MQDDKGLLLRLKENRVEFVIIGGVCGIMHGSSLVTKDLDICCRFTKENLRLIEKALRDVHPIHRLTANKLPLDLTDELCTRLSNLYLKTDVGILDCLSEVSGIGDYQAVLANSVPFQLSFGEIRILSIDALIIAKAAVGRERDLAAVRQLRAIKERTRDPGV